MNFITKLIILFLLLLQIQPVVAADSEYQKNFFDYFCSEEFKGTLLGFASRDRNSLRGELSGWLELLDLTESDACFSVNSDQVLKNKLSIWRNHYSFHPAKYYFSTLFNEQATQIHKIAVFLPFQGKYGHYGQSIKTGIKQSALNSNIEITYYSTSDEHFNFHQAYRNALAQGANCIIGPLRTKILKKIPSITKTLPVLALNYLPADFYSQPYLFQISPKIESLGMALSNELTGEGYTRGILLYPENNHRAERLKDSIIDPFKENYGEWLAVAAFKENTVDFSNLIKNVLNINDSELRSHRLQQLINKEFKFIPRRRQDVEFITVIGEKSQVEMIYPQLSYWYAEDIPVYAATENSDQYHYTEPDLIGLKVFSPPWPQKGRQLNNYSAALEFLGMSAFETIVKSHCFSDLYSLQQEAHFNWILYPEKNQFQYRSLPVEIKF